LHEVHPVLSFDLTKSTFQAQSFTFRMTTVDLLVLQIHQLSRLIVTVAEN
jgi:hypothetical protein